MTTLLQKTAKQRVREHRDQELSKEFRRLRERFPDASVASLVRTISADRRFGLGEQGVKRILYATGTLVPKRARNAPATRKHA